LITFILDKAKATPDVKAIFSEFKPGIPMEKEFALLNWPPFLFVG